MYRIDINNGFHNVRDALVFDNKIIILAWNGGSIINVLQQTIQNLNYNFSNIIGFDFKDSFEFSLFGLDSRN